MRAVVVTLTDLGRSARMQYHAHALAASGADVDLVGYHGTPLPQRLLDAAHVRVHRLKGPRPGPRWRVNAPLAAIDTLRASLRLWRQLRRLRRPDLLLVQNPPALPGLVVTRLSLGRGVRRVIDWHNVGYTLLQRRLGRWHPAVRLVRYLERREARRADAHLCVSRGLAAFLESRFDVRGARVLYDRPPASFAPMPGADRFRFKQAFLNRLGVRGAAGFIICPSSWTEDEDFDVVIDAVGRLEDRARGWEAGGAGRRFPDLVVLVTGDGARRVEFERRFAGLAARRVQFRARWLESEEYPRVVGSADLGLCLHRSASGLDIPMKIAELFGVGVPVCALDYGASLAERVRHGDNGLLFSTASHLADVLFDLFAAYPQERALLERIRAGARKSARQTWEEGWTREAREILLPASRAR